MKYLKQFSIIMSISFIGEILHHFIPLPVPASIYGIVLLFVLLISKIIKPEQISDTAHFLIEIMPIIFIPSVVGLINVYGDIKDRIIAYVLIVIITGVLVFVISGLVTQFVIKTKEKTNG